MSKKHIIVSRIVAVLLIALGLVLGVTWNRERFCIGDGLFSLLGLSAWSKGTSGVHYPAVIGSVIILVGIGLLNYTLGKKTRCWLWTAVVVALAVLAAIFSYV